MIVTRLDLVLLCLTASLVPVDVIENDLVIAFDMKIVERLSLPTYLIVVSLVECLVDIVVVSKTDCKSCIWGMVFALVILEA